MKNIILLVSLIFSINVLADAGFTAGDEFQAHYIEGNLNLTCYGPQGQIQRTIWRCYDNFLTPAMFTKFYSDTGIDADKVKITSTNAIGNSRSKTSRFSSNKGQSKSSFNLWVNTLLQKALLGYGINFIEYELLKDGEEVESGEFEVQVVKQPAKYCQNAWYTSYNMNDCFNPSFVCSRYLHQYRNTCR